MRHVMASADERPDRMQRGATPSRASVTQGSSRDEIQERYLRRAIAEVNELGDELLALGDELHVPVLGSGHPLGDVFLLKYRPTQSEIQEGVAFFGRAGQALLKSLQRLSVDPLAVYGTNCLKFGTEAPADARGWLTRELHIVQPKLVVAMGGPTVAFLDALEFPLSEKLDPERLGEVRPFTPTIEALVTSDIDESLDEQSAKTRFWNAFKALGAWWAELPPY
jgi:uracil-DNA glycosylase